MTFASRQDAGRKLGRHLSSEGVKPDLVLGLPRGGVVVAAEVAAELHRPLQVLVVRKVGHPRYAEFAVGAIAEDGLVQLDQQALAENRVVADELNEVIREEQERLRQYQHKFHPQGAPDLSGKDVMLVDDGIATGATMEAAVHCARKRLAKSVQVAAPVASTHAMNRLRAVADRVHVLEADDAFMAVGQYYDEFPQTSDEEVAALLRH